MKDKQFDTKLDYIIGDSLKLTDEPSPELNNRLKASLYQQEAVMRQTPATRALSLWFLPMVLNLVLCLTLAAAAIMTIHNFYLSFLAAGFCFYIGIAGVLLTMIGTKRTNIKEDITIRVRKRGVYA